MNSAMKTGLILKLDDLINWCNTVFSARMRFSATTPTTAAWQEFLRTTAAQVKRSHHESRRLLCCAGFPCDWNMIDRIPLWQNVPEVSPFSSAFCFLVA